MRQKAFRTARRHTYLVKSLRILLPLTSIILLSSYTISFEKEIKVGDAVVKFECH